jgi:purine-binding chemotaxis protein CheW
MNAQVPIVEWAQAEESPGADAARREFLTFTLGGEHYGIDILQVQEIREIDHVTRVPQVARFVRGVINLRGAIVPIVDLGLMFGFPEALPLEKASVIVLNAERRMVGLVVASVSDVVGLAEDEILPAPEMGERAIGRAIAGIGMRREASQESADSSLLLLDVAHVMRRIREDRE